jgi:hypothetical protein
MAWDKDGSFMTRWNTIDNVTYQFTQTEMGYFNDESSSGVSYQVGSLGTSFSGYYDIWFPEKRDINYIYFNYGVSSDGTASPPGAPSGFYYTTNATNPQDGTWTYLSAESFFTSGGTNVPTTFRGSYFNFAVTGIKAIRLADTINSNVFGSRFFTLYAWHIYGGISSGETLHRIIFCDSTGQELQRDFDYGDQPRGSTRIWSPTTTYNQGSPLYVKNISGTKIARDVTISIETALTGLMSTDILLSKDNISYGTSITFAGDNAPNALMGPIYVKHAPPVNRSFGVEASRLKAAVGQWL